LIAGKGHEDYQIIGREVFHFDDKEVAREALAQKLCALASGRKFRLISFGVSKSDLEVRLCRPDVRKPMAFR